MTKKALDVRTALQNLINASGHISPLNGEASVKAVRLAGKYMNALDDAKRALEHDTSLSDIDRELSEFP